MTPAQRHRSGYSLIELMLALGIMSVGLMMIGTTLPAGIMNSDESNLKTNATIICDNAAAILRTELHHTVLGSWFVQKYVQDRSRMGQFLELSDSRNSLLADQAGFMTGPNNKPSDTGLNFADRFYPRPIALLAPAPAPTTPLPVWPEGTLGYEADPAAASPQLVKLTSPTIGGVTADTIWGTPSATKQKCFTQPISRYAWMVLARPVEVAFTRVNSAVAAPNSTFGVDSNAGLRVGGSVWVVNSSPLSNGIYQITNINGNTISVSPPLAAGAGGGGWMVYISSDIEFVVVPVRRHMAEDPLLEITFWPGQIVDDAGTFQFTKAPDGQQLLDGSGKPFAPKGTVIIAAHDWGLPPPGYTAPQMIAGQYGWALDDSGKIWSQSGTQVVWPKNTQAYAVVDVDLPSSQIKTPNALGLARFRMSLQP